MKFATTTELNQNTNNVLRKVLDDGEDIVLTRNGKPVAMIIPANEDDIEEHILIKHLGLDKSPTSQEITEGKPAKEIFAELRRKRNSKNERADFI
jgi:prevent-host-death family protein